MPGIGRKGGNTMGLFKKKKKKVYAATTIVYDEETKRIQVTGIVSVHKSHASACAALHALGYTYEWTLGKVIDDYGMTRFGAPYLYSPKTLEKAQVREMTLEK